MPNHRFAKGLSILTLLLFVIGLSQCQNEKRQTEVVSVDASWSGTESCQSCHEQEFVLWCESHHYHAMHEAKQQYVSGNFNDQVYEADGVRNHFYRRGEEYWIGIEEDGATQEYKIEYTFGWEPLQQYLVKGERGRLQVLKASWDTEQKGWFHQLADQEIDAHEWLHWTESSMTWNTMCADCHSTNLEKNYFAEIDSFNTVYSEVNLGCESCHGPASLHVEYHTEGEGEEQELRLGAMSEMDEMVDACGPCHSRRSRLQVGSNYTGKYENEYWINALESGVYHPDGQILEEDYVLGSFMQSKMYHEGVKCTDCHDAHSYELKMIGNDLCGQCHEPSYNGPEHHFHTEEVACVDCHMPGKMYMGNDFRRDHSFRIPRPDQSIQYETPNACKDCHTDKENMELYLAIEEWYGTERMDIYSNGLLIASEMDPLKAQEVIAFVRNGNQPAIMRAAAMDYLLRTDFSQAPSNSDSLFLWAEEGTKSEDYLVRLSSLDAFLNMDAQSRMNVAFDRLADPTRSVRIVAARLTEDIAPSDIPESYKEAWRKANKEYKEYLYANADFREGRSLLAEHHFRTGNFSQAQYWWEKALDLDPDMVTQKFGLSLIYAQQGDLLHSKDLIIELINADPNDGDLWYRLALAYTELEERDNSIVAFNECLDLGFI